ncbi:MAG: preQ(1) synthase [Gemmatimonadota bacterium]|uniref:preQ(1) synthase n=1 Tax=Candidatus Palauibacter soopunensis TaxID=3056739 RepID=UPI00239D369E|nr:preQ(1) synthase [Candidatus Palauibacter soopunensis]MDE2877558.1 preQ(1) synthase [Candidatus Palauibacter soopunensis]MDE2944178.1 preQ(1) synthase [Gemmatimonadota bacterium]
MTRLPAAGPLPRPRDPEEGRETLRAEAIPAADVQRVRLRALEFTSLCPKTGQPDFGRVTIDYEPRDRCLESKALKFYLWSFRDEGEFCETLAARIADDVVFAIDPRRVRVDVEQNVRGGIEIVATAERGEAAAD